MTPPAHSERCHYCAHEFPVPVSLHHSEEECASLGSVQRDGEAVAAALETLTEWALERDIDPEAAHPMVRASLDAGHALQRLLARCEP